MKLGLKIPISLHWNEVIDWLRSRFLQWGYLFRGTPIAKDPIPAVWQYQYYTQVFFSTLMSTHKKIRYFRQGRLPSPPSLWLSQFTLKSNRLNGDEVRVSWLVAASWNGLSSVYSWSPVISTSLSCLPFCPPAWTLLSKYIANIFVFFFLLYPRAKEKDPTQFRDVFIHHCIVLNKKGNLCTVSFKKLNK